MKWGAGLTALSFMLATGCADLLADLRPDLNDGYTGSDEPTMGGRWAERGLLSDSGGAQSDSDHFNSVGHTERSPASQGTDSYSREAWDGSSDPAGGDPQQPSFGSNPNLPPPTQRQYKNGSRATRADFVDDSTSEGSLWASDGQTNYYFTKNKVRSVGDLLTITLENDLIHDIGLEVKRTLNERERDAEVALAEDRARARIPASAGAAAPGKDALGTSQSAPAAAAPDGSAPSAGTPEILPSDIDVSKSLELKAGDAIMAEIVERYPNGNYKIRGSKRVMYRNGSARLVNLTAVVRNSDIGEDDVVTSGKLYEYRLEAVH